ncbi:MAG: hypothetical protein WAT81_00130 [Candidatus Moraniibacteriota bacterium]
MRNFTRLPLFLIVFLSILFLVAGNEWLQYQKREPSPSYPVSVDYSAVIEQGMKFYTEQELESLRIDDYLLFVKIKHTRGEAVPTESHLAYAQDPFRRILAKNNPLRDIQFALPEVPSTDVQLLDRGRYVVNPALAGFLRDPWDDILLRALYCDVGNYDERDFRLLRTLGGDAGYLDTHALLGLIILRENHCYKAALIDQEIELWAQQIERTMDNDFVFSDVYTERIVFLYWAGYGNLVKKEWVDRVVRNLTQDPGWRTGKDTASNAHTTGLALLSLLYFSDGSPLQPLYDEE